MKYWKNEILPLGKIESDILEKVVFENIKNTDEDVEVDGSLGEDCAVVKAGNKLAVLSTDPITASVKDIGRLAIHITCNDIATKGILPSGILLAIMLPEGSSVLDLETIIIQATETARELGVSIVGGHTEVTRSVNQPIIVSTAIGVAENKKDDNAEIGDIIIMTKRAGIEGSGIIASDREKELEGKMTKEEILRAKNFLNQASVVKEGIVAGSLGVCKMHDITEGGVLGAIWETCHNLGLGCEINKDKILVYEETKKISDIFDIDYLKLISSGSMLIVVKKDKAEKLISNLKAEKIESSIIGVLKDKNYGMKVFENVIEENGILITRCFDIKPPKRDELYKAL